MAKPVTRIVTKNMPLADHDKALQMPAKNHFCALMGYTIMVTLTIAMLLLGLNPAITPAHAQDRSIRPGANGTYYGSRNNLNYGTRGMYGSNYGTRGDLGNRPGRNSIKTAPSRMLPPKVGGIDDSRSISRSTDPDRMDYSTEDFVPQDEDVRIPHTATTGIYKMNNPPGLGGNPDNSLDSGLDGGLGNGADASLDSGMDGD